MPEKAAFTSEALRRTTPACHFKVVIKVDVPFYDSHLFKLFSSYHAILSVQPQSSMVLTTIANIDTERR